jgi:adenylate kinase family enzyme
MPGSAAAAAACAYCEGGAYAGATDRPVSPSPNILDDMEGVDGARRIMVVGCAGSGKTTVARLLGERLELPVIHLDSEYWRPGWTAPLPEEWDRRIDQLITCEVWVMDGNYGGTLERRLARAEAAVFLDLSRWSCLLGVFRRALATWGRTRPDMAAGCVERLPRMDFLRWMWGWPRRSRPRVMTSLAASGLPVVHLRSRREIERWLMT